MPNGNERPSKRWTNIGRNSVIANNPSLLLKKRYIYIYLAVNKWISSRLDGQMGCKIFLRHAMRGAVVQSLRRQWNSGKIGYECGLLSELGFDLPREFVLLLSGFSVTLLLVMSVQWNFEVRTNAWKAVAAMAESLLWVVIVMVVELMTGHW